MLSGNRRPADGPHVLIVGGGFAGLSALHALSRSNARLTLVDRNMYSTFQPLLYQVATAGLTAADVASPARPGPTSARASSRAWTWTGGPPRWQTGTSSSMTTWCSPPA